MKRLLYFLLIGSTFFLSCDDDLDAIDYTLFDATLEEARNAADINREGQSNGDIIVGSTVILNGVIDTYAPYRETAINQGTIDIATQRLRDAIDQYESSVVIIEGTFLGDAIELAQNLHDNAEEGVFPGQYAVGSKAILQSAIDAAQLVLDDATSTQAQVDSALSTLLTAVNTFNAGEVLPLDFSLLIQAINDAQNLHDNAVEGTDIGNYAVGSKAVLQQAIDNANVVANTTSGLVQSAIDTALADLQNAVSVFENGRIGGPTRDTTALEAKITEAQSVHDGAVEGTAMGEYPVGSKATLQAAINDAQAVVDDLSLGQGPVDAAIATLQSALNDFLNSINGIAVINFSGDDYIETPNFQGIAGGGARTMEAWINTSSNTHQTTLILSWGVNSPQQKWDMRINGGKLRIEFNGGGLNGSTTINDGQWHHVAIVVPSTAGSLNDVLLYVDGVEETTSGGSGNAINTSTANNFNIGRSASQTDRFFAGLMSDVRIWNVGRTAAEIAANKDVRLSGNEPGLVGYWKLNENSGTTAPDSSPSGFNGVFVGSPTWNIITSGLPFND